jgi:hypothetical protein
MERVAEATLSNTFANPKNNKGIYYNNIFLYQFNQNCGKLTEMKKCRWLFSFHEK